MSHNKRKASPRAASESSKASITEKHAVLRYPTLIGLFFFLVLLAGLALGGVLAPSWFGQDEIGQEVEGPELLSDQNTTSLNGEQKVAVDGSDLTEEDAAVAPILDWSVAPSPRTEDDSLSEGEERIEVAKGRAYDLLGEADSVPYIHANFYPFTKISSDTYYSALVDLTFFVDPSTQVISSICQGKATTASASCRTSP